MFLLKLNIKKEMPFKRSVEKKTKRRINPQHRKSNTFHTAAWTVLDMASALTCTISQLGGTVVNEEGSKDAFLPEINVSGSL